MMTTMSRTRDDPSLNLPLEEGPLSTPLPQLSALCGASSQDQCCNPREDIKYHAEYRSREDQCSWCEERYGWDLERVQLEVAVGSWLGRTFSLPCLSVGRGLDWTPYMLRKASCLKFTHCGTSVVL
jgi:hypothetical protein